MKCPHCNIAMDKDSLAFDNVCSKCGFRDFDDDTDLCYKCIFTDGITCFHKKENGIVELDALPCVYYIGENSYKGNEMRDAGFTISKYLSGEWEEK